MNEETNVYRTLQKHMDRLPVGFPATKSGVDQRILERLFTEAEAEIALGLDFTFRTAEQIHQSMQQRGISLKELEERLGSMVNKGSISSRRRGAQTQYAAAPFILGMIEMQLNNLSPALVRDTRKFLHEGYGLEYLSTPVPQARIIPVEESIRAEHRVATYDELDKLIEKADPIVLLECICRKMGDIYGQSCSVTNRREVCMVFGDFAEYYLAQGIGKKVSRAEALAVARENAREGLVLQPSNEQEPFFICACCGDCCGLLMMAKRMKRPVDFIASNYTVKTNEELCTGCGICVDRCQMDAIRMRNEVAVVDERRCIGCGNCVSTCKPGAHFLVAKAEETVPPATIDELYEVLKENKQSGLQKLATGMKGMIGIKQRRKAKRVE
jgi:ferredoxin